MSRTRLILIPEASGDPAPFMVVDASGAVLQRGLLHHDAAPPPAVPTVAVVPGVDVSIHWLDLPTGGTAQVTAAALWKLRADLAGDTDVLSLTLGPPQGAGQPRMVVVVSRALLGAWDDYLAGLGVQADVFTPDVLTLPEPQDPDGVTAVTFGGAVALRGHRFAVSVQADLVDMVAAGRAMEMVDQPAEIEALMIRAALAPSINLKGDRHRGHAVKAGGWRRPALLAAALALSPLVVTAAAAGRDAWTANRIETASRQIAMRHWPDLASEADPAGALRRRIETAPPAVGVAATSAALFAAVEAVEGAELDSLIVDPEQGARATVSYVAYEDLDRMKRIMAEGGLSVSDDSTVEDQGRIVSDIRIGNPA